MDRFDLTCASASSASGWLFAGDRAGRILALPSAEAAAPAWVVDACAAAVTVRAFCCQKLAGSRRNAAKSSPRC